MASEMEKYDELKSNASDVMADYQVY